MRSDLEAAAEIQKALLPPVDDEIGNVRFASAFRPCDELGGDIFNIFRLDEKHVGAYILDVSGHGVSASLLSVALSRIMTPLPDQSSLLKQRIGRTSKFRIVRPAEVAVTPSVRHRTGGQIGRRRVHRHCLVIFAPNSSEIDQANSGPAAALP